MASMALVCLLLAPSVAYADGTIEVNTQTDEFGGIVDLGCSLREAVHSANTESDFGGCVRADSAPYTITVPAGTYTLLVGGSGEDANAEGDLDILTSLSIVGNSASDTIIQSGAVPDSGIDRLFHVSGTVDVQIANVTLQNGVTEPGGSGGAILASPGAQLHVTDATIADNRSGRAGGGIELNATITNTVGVTLTNVTFLRNGTGDTPGNGGALHTTGPGTVHVMGGSVISNTAAAEGGGLWNSAVGTMVISGTLFSDNLASGGDADQGGGALFNDGGDMMVTNAIISNNRADGASGSGGGILNNGGVLSVLGGQISDNSANRAGGGIEDNASAMTTTVTVENVSFMRNATGSSPGNGGALHITGPGEVSVRGGSVMNNTASAEGGGLWNSAVGSLTISGTTIISNTASGNDADQGGGGLFNDGGVMVANNVTLSDNVADGAAGSGGGVLVNAGGSFTITNSAINGNRASRAGGGIEVNATMTDTSSVTIDEVDFMENATGSSPGNGGALHITGPAEVSVRGGSVMNNTASAEGGGLWNSAVGSLTISGTTIISNTASGNDADQGGGGLFNDGGVMVANNVTLSDNVADGAAGSGGGVLVNAGGSFTITNSAINGNRASRAGGGIEVNATMTDTSSVTIDEVDFMENATGSSPGNGGALHITGPAEVSVRGGSVMNNTASAEGGGLWNSAVGSLTISGTTIISNTASGGDADQGGGGLFNDGGVMTVANAVIDDNRANGAAGSGGGIFNNGGTLTVSNSRISQNVSNRAGGGVEDNAGTGATFSDVTFDGNETGASPGNGGALHITGAGAVTVTMSTVTNNVAAAEGGGLWNSAAGVLTVSRSTLAGNVASGSEAENGGGALYNDGGALTISNSTVSANSADLEGGGFKNVGTANVVNVTFFENSAQSGAGGIANSGTLDIVNSIVAHTSASGDDCTGVVAGDFNLDSDSSCQAAITANPMLGPLQDNGGSTQTHALLADSPAIDAGDDATCAAPPINGVDQRGVNRSIGAACDLGAYEGSMAEFMKSFFFPFFERALME